MMRGTSFEEDEGDIQGSISMSDLASSKEKYSASEEQDHNETFSVDSKSLDVKISSPSAPRKHLARQDSFDESDFVLDSNSSLDRKDTSSTKTKPAEIEYDENFTASTGSLSVDDLPPSASLGNRVHESHECKRAEEEDEIPSSVSLNLSDLKLSPKHPVSVTVDSFNIDCYSVRRASTHDATTTRGTTMSTLRPSTVRGTSFDEDDTVGTSDDEEDESKLVTEYLSGSPPPDHKEASFLPPSAMRCKFFDDEVHKLIGRERRGWTEYPAKSSSKLSSSPIGKKFQMRFGKDCLQQCFATAK